MVGHKYTRGILGTKHKYKERIWHSPWSWRAHSLVEETHVKKSIKIYIQGRLGGSIS